MVENTDLVEATYKLLIALKHAGANCERDGRGTVVVYLDGDDFHHAAWSLRDTAHRVALTGHDIMAMTEFSVNGIVFRRRGRRPK